MKYDLNTVWICVNKDGFRCSGGAGARECNAPGPQN